MSADGVRANHRLGSAPLYGAEDLLQVFDEGGGVPLSGVEVEAKEMVSPQSSEPAKFRIFHILIHYSLYSKME